MILIVDNYDSFVHNVACYFEELGQTTRVVRNDVVTAQHLGQAKAIVISPGPCSPHEAGQSMAIMREERRDDGRRMTDDGIDEAVMGYLLFQSRSCRDSGAAPAR